ncbi:ribosome biogenesis protein Nop53/GLTSCR2 [Roridomyces roridus]|uniref:Ribosome biogenesis protein NOP53 n=1 Tax=Roridomyces roridus TaxID=1738132 RepID=A0AAD7BKN6_9AGAR|nr:ribosome biogenesis protein Nop53/GLTSCR2 [Roridomyces roridus]
MPKAAQASETKKPVKSAIGAPSQLNQSSRKGKKAWRKNVDIQDVEAGLEELRSEERATGTYLHKQQDDQLFVVDVKGDDKTRKTLSFKSSQTTAAKILAQRSAVPAVMSRTTATKRKSPLSAEDKDRLLRISKRPRRGPFNVVMDPTELGAGSATLELSEAVKASGTYDAWAPEEEVEIKDGLEIVQAKKIKPPVHSNPRDKIEVPAILEPHQGTSYNPPADAHNELLIKAADIEEKRVAKEAKLAETKIKIDQAKQSGNGEVAIPGVPSGMKLDIATPGPDDGEDAVETDDIPKKMPARKTKAQRNKAARILAEKRALAEKARRKNEQQIIHSYKLLRRNADSTISAREQAHALRRAALQEKLKRGLAGQKLGKHKVPAERVDVQLGEDLSESLRGLKPEGNLFRDRFTSLQQRALVEPRVPVLPTRRRHRMIGYEKHAWKRFK